MSRLTLILAAAALALALGACATPPVALPEATVLPASSACAADAPGGDAVPADRPASQGWWKTLADPELEALLTRSRAGNLDVAVALARLEQARAGVAESSAARAPRVDAVGAVSRERVPRSSVRDSEGLRAETPPFRQSRFAAQVEASYEIDLLGRLKSGQQAAELEQAASECDLEAARRWLVREVVLAYADIRSLDDQLQDHRRAVALQHAILQAETSRLEAGVGTRAEVLEAQSDLSQLQDADVVLQRDRASALTRLAVLTGSSAADLKLPPVEGYFSRTPLSGAVPAGLSASAVAERPDVAAAWQRVVAAGVEARRTQLERYPALTLTGSTGYVSEALRRWLTRDALVWVAQAALQLPLLDGGRREARTKLATATLAEQNALYRKTVLEALAEIDNALHETQAAGQRLQIAEQQRQRRAADRDALRAAVRAGVSGRPALLRSERALLDATTGHHLRRHELMTAWVAAQKALGR
ncbi:efflux transporter outer membrane subunit [Aquabacterium sp. A7-Y]|uniref:efflux transporter outer membrane subunit n=1 Tax=Aquabacterium sp. A7-Y TaxID=1349605 RepID=UPI00223E64ED|nr:efflux transporter outer membrane subunit [Aquabacterium sp. A7-Y]MCW7539461.1 efflux transporter outer membrane subunit [Aquabacterium sp. A7-Y]